MGLTHSGWRHWLSAMATNVAIAVLVATMIWLIGVGPFMLVQLCDETNSSLIKANGGP